MVIEHALEQLLATISDTSILAQMLRSTKEKMLVTILKDQNSSVRDACVGLLSSYKALLPDDSNVADMLKQLPKYRVTEILKKTTT